MDKRLSVEVGEQSGCGMLLRVHSSTHSLGMRVLSIAYSFSPDGKTIVSGGGIWNDGKIYLWDVTTGENLHALTGHGNSVESVAFSPDGQTIASGSGDDTIRLWDVATGAHLRTLTGHEGSVYSISFSPDGQTIASGSDDGTIRLWDVNTGTGWPKILIGHTGPVRSISFSPDGQTIASGSDDGTIRLVGMNQRLHPCGPTQVIRFEFTVSLSVRMGQTLVNGNSDGTIRLWDVDTGELKHTLIGHRSSIESVAFSPDGKTLASGSDDDNNPFMGC